MPELPDVEAFRKQAEKARGKKIVTVSINPSRVLRVSGKTLRKHLLGNAIKGTGRHGKYMFIPLDGVRELVLHFGMTGYLSYSRREAPDHTVLDIRFADGHSLSYVSVRKLGKVDMARSRDEYVKKANLGPDAFRLKEREFSRIIGGRGGNIKSALMDQSLMAGIGNIYSDEILYQAGIHPGRKTGSISDRDSLYRAMHGVLREAIKSGALPEKMPVHFLLRRRKEGKACGKCSGRISKKTINGRSSYFCDSHQE